jgi:hypothetical protein
VAVDHPARSSFGRLPAAFSVRDEGQGRQVTPDLGRNLWILCDDCGDPAVIQLTLPCSPLESGNISIKAHTPKSCVRIVWR